VKSLVAEILQKINSIWEIGNVWLRWIAILAIAVPVLTLVAAMSMPPNLAVTVIPILALLPIAGLVGLGLLQPMVIAAAATLEVGRKAISTVAFVLGADLVFGVYLSLVPISNDRRLVPLFVLALVTILLLRIGNARGIVPSLLMLLAIAITVTFFIGGRGKITDTIRAWSTRATNQNVQDQITANYNPTRICEDAWEATSDHREEDIAYFDVRLKSGCWSQFVYLPKSWNKWFVQPVGDTGSWWVSLWYAGMPNGKGPYGPGNLSETSSWIVGEKILRLQGNGTIRFYTNAAPRAPMKSDQTTQAGPSALPENPPEPHPLPVVASAQSDNILYAAHPCIRIDSSVTCTISITNQLEDERWEMIQPGSTLLEDSGDQHYTSNIRGPNNYPPNHVVNVNLTFSGVGHSARTCTLNIRHHGNGEHSEQKSVILDHVPIEAEGAETLGNITPASPSVSPNNPPEPHSFPIVATAQSDDILYAAHPCIRADTTVTCTISVTNQLDSERWENIQRGSTLLEDTGDQHYSSDVRGPYMYLPNHAMNVRLFFSGVSHSARTCTLNIRHHGNGDHVADKSVILDHVPIE
jgi:hypothetical protein